MSDTDTIDQNPAETLENEVKEGLSEGSFNIDSWLAGASYPEKDIEIYRDGEALDLLKEAQISLASVKDRSPKSKKPQSMSIVDEISDTATELQEQITALVEQLKSSAAKFHLSGLAPSKRDDIDKKVAKALQPTAPVYEGEGEDRILVEDGIPGGEQHPDYNDKLRNALMAASVTSANGTPLTLSVPQVEALFAVLPGIEATRLANAVFDVNFLRYNIDSLVDVDFS